MCSFLGPGKATNPRETLVGQKVRVVLSPGLGLLLVSESFEDLEPRPLLDVRNVEFPEQIFLLSKLVPHVQFELSPGGIGSFRLVLRASCPTTDDFKVSTKSVDLVPDSGESIKKLICLLKAMEACPLDLERSFEGVLDGRLELGSLVGSRCDLPDVDLCCWSLWSS